MGSLSCILRANVTKSSFHTTRKCITHMDQCGSQWTLNRELLQNLYNSSSLIGASACQRNLLTSNIAAVTNKKSKRIDRISKSSCSDLRCSQQLKTCLSPWFGIAPALPHISESQVVRSALNCQHQIYMRTRIISLQSIVKA